MSGGGSRERPVRVCRVIARLNVGGPAQHVATLSAGLVREGFATTLVAGELAPGEADMSDLAEHAGVRLVRLRSLGRVPRPFRDLATLFALVRLFRAERPAIVHTHTAKAGALGRIAAALAGVPVRVHTFHGHVLEGYFPPLASRAVRAAERLLAALATRVVALSPRQARDLARRFRVVPRGRVEVIPVGIDLAPFHEARARHAGSLRREVGVSPAAPLLGTAGRLVPVKAIDLLLAAFAEVRRAREDAVLAIAGEGTERPALEARARALGVADAVRFLGLRRDLPRLYADLDLFLLSSRNEGTPVALIEALAAGVAAVATDVGGVADVLGPEPRPGVLVPAGDAAAIARAAIHLIARPEERAQRAAVGPERAARFAAERLVADTAALYRRLLRK